MAGRQQEVPGASPPPMPVAASGDAHGLIFVVVWYLNCQPTQAIGCNSAMQGLHISNAAGLVLNLTGCLLPTHNQANFPTRKMVASTEFQRVANPFQS